jgi:hypothetical protein
MIFAKIEPAAPVVSLFPSSVAYEEKIPASVSLFGLSSSEKKPVLPEAASLETSSVSVQERSEKSQGSSKGKGEGAQESSQVSKEKGKECSKATRSSKNGEANPSVSRDDARDLINWTDVSHITQGSSQTAVLPRFGGGNSFGSGQQTGAGLPGASSGGAPSSKAVVGSNSTSSSSATTGIKGAPAKADVKAAAVGNKDFGASSLSGTGDNQGSNGIEELEMDEPAPQNFFQKFFGHFFSRH